MNEEKKIETDKRKKKEEIDKRERRDKNFNY